MPLTREQMRQQALAEKTLRDKTRNRLDILERKVDRLVATPAAAGTGATTFLGLTDTPGSYSTHGSKLVRVNSGATALEFVALSGLDHGDIGGLSDDDHSIYALLAGRSGGQTWNGGTASGNSAVIHGSTHGTKGPVQLNPTSGGVVVGASSLTSGATMEVGASGAAVLYVKGGSGNPSGVAVERPSNSWGRLNAGGSSAVSFFWQNSGNFRLIEADSGETALSSSYTGTKTRVIVDSSGNMGIATTSPTAKLDINSDVLRLRTAKTPATAGAAGNAGDICWDSGFIYVCTATNSWERVAIATW